MEIDAELLAQQASDSASADTATATATAAVAAVNKEHDKELEQPESNTNQTTDLDKDEKKTKDTGNIKHENKSVHHEPEVSNDQLGNQQNQADQQYQYHQLLAQTNFKSEATNPAKPPHGSPEWHRQRRENHKEVERKRRESINIGIRELARLIPTTDTNKAQILQRAVEYIKRLKENENNNIEKWTLEKLLTEQAVSELSASNEKLKHELELAYREIEQLKRGKK